jgi:Beta-galactosidase
MGISRLQYATRALLGICLLSSIWPLARAQPSQGLERGDGLQCASTGNAIPNGLVVLLPSGEKNYQSMNLQVLNNPYISGVAVQINWRDIEPIQGKPDWTPLDALFAAAESSKKWVHLIMFPGFFSPAWALEGAQTDLFSIQYGPGKGTDARLPMPWDRVYLDHWFSFMKLLSARYGRSPAFRMIAAAGPTSVSVEMTLPNSPTAHRQWLKDSYTPAKYLRAWEDAFHFYAGAFPKQCMSLAAPGLPILGPGEKGRPAHLRAKHEVVAQAMRILGNRLAIQSSDLHAGHANVEAPDGTDFITGYSGRIITGFEMRSGSQDDVASKVMGAEGNPPLALRRSIDKGMAPNNAGRHVNYLEIYVADVFPADMQPDLSYAASLFRPVAHETD